MDGKIFDEIIASFADQVLLQGNGIVGFRVHEMIAVVIFVTELELFSLDIDQLDLVGGTEANVGAFAGVDVANDGLDKGA